MGAKGAVEILHRKADSDERARLVAAYEERLLNPYIAAERGTIDAVIDPAYAGPLALLSVGHLAGVEEQRSPSGKVVRKWVVNGAPSSLSGM